jgi:hypothetical protein
MQGLYRDLHDERPGGVAVYFISHVGGHKYAANVLIYRRRDFEWYKKQTVSQPASSKEGLEETPVVVAADTGEDSEEARDKDRQDTAQADGDGWSDGAVQGIWLARVRPEDCEGIVKFTVLQGKVVKPSLQLRGGFDREKGLISW